MWCAKGFTLVELLVVISTLTVCIFTALPDMVKWRNHAAYRSAARELVSAMRLARSHAISRTREVELDIDLDLNRYRMRVGNQAYGSDSWFELSPWASLPSAVRLGVTKDCDKVGDGNSATNHIDTIQFNPNGTCGALGAMAGNYVCVMSRDLVPQFAGAILSYSTGRAVVKRWDPLTKVWSN